MARIGQLEEKQLWLGCSFYISGQGYVFFLNKVVTTTAIFPLVISLQIDSSGISLSTPISSISTDSRSESPAKQKVHQAGVTARLPKKVNHGSSRISTSLSAGYTLSVKLLYVFSTCIQLENKSVASDD